MNFKQQLNSVCHHALLDLYLVSLKSVDLVDLYICQSQIHTCVALF